MDRDRPIVRIQASERGKRITGSRLGIRRPKLTPEVQSRRLGPALERRLDDAIRGRIDIAQDPRGLAAERALVLEVIGGIGDFAKAAARIGLDWLAEEVTRVELDDELYGVFRRRQEEQQESEFADEEEDALQAFISGSEETPTMAGRLYFGMPTVETFKKFQSLWNNYKSGERPPDGYSDWWSLFGLLKDVRGWGPADRVTPDTREHLAALLSENPNAIVKVEVDLWYRGAPEDRQQAFEQFKQHLNEMSGQILDSAEIGEIRYHAVLVSLPAVQVHRLTALTGSLSFAEEIMSISPQSILSVKPITSTPDNASIVRRPAPPRLDARPPIAALLDGYPIADHDLLRNRIKISEHEIRRHMADIDKRYHGTAMASLILHGDLAGTEPSLNRTLQVVPVLATTQSGDESSPPDKLPLAMIQRAINLLKAPGGTGGEAPKVLIVNHSLGGVQFSGSMSPWARMLDYLAYERKILFVVSGGNISDQFGVDGYTDIPGFRRGNQAERQDRILLGIDGHKARRAMRNPGEQMNGLTVAAIHADESEEFLPPNAINPYHGPFTNLWSGLGLGFRRTVKPDIAAPGGRLAAQPNLGPPFAVHGHPADQFGQLAACPDPRGSTGKSRRSVGTSNSAALTTRAALHVADALDLAFESDNTDWENRPTAAVMLKALVAHSASWGPAGEHLEGLLPPRARDKWFTRRENVARHLGYGQIDPTRVVSGSTHRITLLGDGLIRKGNRHSYVVPLPTDLSSREDLRRIIVTLAWMTPIQPGSQNYRKIGLEVVPKARGEVFWPGVERIGYKQPPLFSGRQGTLVHSVYEGTQRMPIVEGDTMTFNVQAYSRFSGVTKLDVPYALAVTIEVAPSLRADIYQQIRNRVQPRVRA